MIHSTLSAQSQLLMTDILINNKKLTCLCDTGAEVNLLPAEFAERHCFSVKCADGIQPVSVDQTPVRCSGVTFASLKVGPTTYANNTKFYAVHGIEYGILGLPLLSQLGVTINCGTKTVHMGGILINNAQPSVQTATIKTARVCRIRLSQTTVIRPGQETFLSAQIEGNTGSPFEGVVEPLPDFIHRSGLAVAAVKVPKGQSSIPVCVTNIWDHPIRVWRCQAVAELAETDIIEEIDASKKYVNDPVKDVQIGKTISDDQSDQLKSLLQKNKDIFESPGNQGLTSTMHHSIEVKSSQPINCAPRRLPLGCVDEVNKKIDTLHKEGKIEPSHSPWAFPIVPVKKKDGSVRICVDYRPLNKITESDTFPTGNVQDCLDKLSDACYFSTIDFAQGYMQVPLTTEDREKTAFRSPTGLWQWTRMPQGLKNSPATWCRLMQRVFNNIPQDRLILYMDDICIMSKTFEEHLQKLQEIFDCLRKHGLRINAKKCHLAMDEVVWLGHKVSRDGVSPDVEKTSAVCQWKTLRDTKEIQTFLGICGWWRKFIPNYAQIVKPLYKLLEKDNFEWNETAEEAFKTLKHCLITAPVLGHPNPKKQFLVTTDASDIAIGGALLQEDNSGNLRPLAYFSRALSKRERGYSTYDREAMAIRDTLHHFRHYLLGNKFLLKTDHKPLVYLRDMKDPYGRRGRLLSDIEEYDFTIQHIKGTENTLADALSRFGYEKVDNKITSNSLSTQDIACQTENIPPKEREQQVATATHVHMGQQGTTVHNIQGVNESAGQEKELTLDIKTLQKEDKEISQVFTWFTNRDNAPKPSDVQSRSLKTLFREWIDNKLVVKDDILYRRYQLPGRNNVYYQIVIPKCCTEKVFQEFHDNLCHMGSQKTLLKIKMRYYWPGMTADIDTKCKQCNICQRRQSPTPKSRALLQQIVATRPGEIVHADLLELTKTANGNKYVLALMDAFTKFVNVYPVSNQRADTIADIILNHYMPEHGVIEQLHTDQGGGFEAKLMKEVCEILQIRKTRTTGYHPQSNGLIERFNRTLINMLAKHHEGHPEDWDKHLSLTSMAYNSTVHTSTGYTPYFLTHGREMRLPVDLLIPVDPPDFQHQSTTSFARTTKNALSDAFQIANSFLDGARKRQKHGYDKWAKEHPYSVGDRVWLFDPTVRRGRANKRVLPWVGPYIIRKTFDTNDEKGVTYRIQLETGRRRIVVHHNRLKPCIGPRKDTGRQSQSDNNHQGRGAPIVSHQGQTDGGIQVTANTERVTENEDDEQVNGNGESEGQASDREESEGQASDSEESEGQANDSGESEGQASDSGESGNVEQIYVEHRTRSGRLINPPARFR